MELARPKVLIVGGTGLLGEALFATSAGRHEISVIHLRNYSVKRAGVNYIQTDIREHADLASLFARYHFDVVIHAAGIANVDYVEHHIEEGWRSNVVGTQNVVDFARKKNLQLIYISSNAVFDGTAAPYRESDPTNPVNKYGQIKVECENTVWRMYPEATIVRPILMYGFHLPQARSNPATWIIGRLQRKEVTHLVTDVYENPLWANQCAEAIWRAIALQKTGVFHVAGKNVVNRFEFATTVAKVFGLDASLLHPVDSGYFPLIAPRPRNTSFLTERMEAELKVQPLTVAEGLERMRISAESSKVDSET